MRSQVAPRLRAAKAVRIVTVTVAMCLTLPAVAQAQFQLGLQDPALQQVGNAAKNQAAYNAFSTVNGKIQRIDAYWYQIAPGSPPAGFVGSNPGSPGYSWAALDMAVRLAAQHHKQILLTSVHAPTWATGANFPNGQPHAGDITPGSWEPNISMFTQFTHALAERYSGNYPDAAHPGTKLPRVKYYEIWNEPNISGYLAARDQAGYYRTMLNAGYGAVKSVHSDNKVIFGGMAGVGGYDRWSIPPLKFAAEVMCLRVAGRRFLRNPSCPVRAHFDALAEHPYSFASSPTKHAYKYDDLLIADMSKLHNLLDTAKRLHTIRGDNQQLWATEFGWVTNPPNTSFGDPQPTAARFVSYSLYELWSADVSTVIYASVVDPPTSANIGMGLLNTQLAPKLTLDAVAFPFVASVNRGGGYAWGRLPVSARVQVFVQQRIGRQWRTVKSVRSGGDGVFTAHFRARGNGTYRAQVSHGRTSLSYFSATIPGKRLHLASSLLG